MAQVKKRFSLYYQFLYAWLLTILGFQTSCEVITPRAEYGSPHAKFKINGKINNASTNKAIEGIQIAMFEQYLSADTTMLYPLDSTLSHTDGFYELISNSFASNVIFKIVVKDIDGELNGAYSNIDTLVEFVDPQFTGGDGSWYYGEASKQINITLKLKN